MRLLMLTKYGRLGASSRLRSLAYLPAMQAAEWQVTLSPLLPDGYVAGLQQGKRALTGVPRAYLERMASLRTAIAFDLVWIEKDALPWLPGFVETGLLGSRVRCVLDYDDAVFHHYDLHSSSVVRALLGSKHDKLMRRAALVIAGNDYLAERARSAGATNVHIVPTVVDIARYPDACGRQPHDGPAEVVWIGQRSTARYLQPLVPVMRKLAEIGLCRFTAIGIDAAQFGLPMHSLPWDEASEGDMLSQFDMGIMPLPDSPFERGKCGYKLIQYMACGLPVVASPVGVNSTLVHHGTNGWLAESAEEWVGALSKLAEDPGLRWRMGAAGRAMISREYSLEATTPTLLALLRTASLQGYS